MYVGVFVDVNSEIIKKV